jgi:N6-L-threonylcarbamoyladenine synthase
MLVLGIESTCDETACAIVQDGKHILSNVISSQIDLHKEYGGVVPELACRRHIDIIMPIIDQALSEAKLSIEDIDLIAVAHGPGLIGPLLIGLNTAKALAFGLNKPFIGVNHIEAHLYAAMMSLEQPLGFPCLGAVLSGGHTSLVRINALGNYQLISQTVDDAIGEAFDKVAKMLGLYYPGGPEIEKLALKGDPFRFPYRGGQIKGKPLDFSFSGLKTAVLYSIKALYPSYASDFPLSDQERNDIAASFQRAACEDVLKKTLSAAAECQARAIIFGGGVTNNRYLRELFNKAETSMPLIWPPAGLSLDNAAMIAGLGYHTFQREGRGDPFTLDPLARIPFSA